MRISSKKFDLNINLSQIFSQVFYKSIAAFQRLLGAVKLFPIRSIRLVHHFWIGLKSIRFPKIAHETPNKERDVLDQVFNWLVELIVYILDCLAIGELYETICDFVKFNTRPLYHWEIKLAKSVFGDSINYNRVRIDEYAFIGPKQHRICYVSFYTINSWGLMENSLLLHELTHVWQYEQIGAVYIPRALGAQFSKMGYNYGGVSTLRAYWKKGKDIFSFNLEQQGDIVSDYYRIKDGYRPRWGNGARQDLPIYENYIQQLKSGWAGGEQLNKI